MLQNVSIGIVGVGTPYQEFNDDETSRFLDMIQGEERRGAPAAAAEVPTEERPGNSPTDPSPTVAMETE